MLHFYWIMCGYFISLAFEIISNVRQEDRKQKCTILIKHTPADIVVPMRNFWLWSHGSCTAWMHILIPCEFGMRYFCIWFRRKIRISTLWKIGWILVIISWVISTWFLVSSYNCWWACTSMASSCTTSRVSTTTTSPTPATATIWSCSYGFIRLRLVQWQVCVCLIWP